MPAVDVAMPYERAAQLRMVAEKRGTTVVSVIESFLVGLIASGEIADVTPGVRIEVAGASVNVWWTTAQPIPCTMTGREAAELADELPAKTGIDCLTLLESGAFVRVAPRGRGTTIQFQPERRDDGSVLHVNSGIATDLARQLRNAAASIVAPLAV